MEGSVANAEYFLLRSISLIFLNISRESSKETRTNLEVIETFYPAPVTKEPNENGQRQAFKGRVFTAGTPARFCKRFVFGTACNNGSFSLMPFRAAVRWRRRGQKHGLSLDWAISSGSFSGAPRYDRERTYDRFEGLFGAEFLGDTTESPLVARPAFVVVYDGRSGPLDVPRAIGRSCVFVCVRVCVGVLPI